MSNRERFASVCYWVAVVLTFSTVALVFLRNTTLIFPLEHTSFPLAWKLGIGAVVAFVARELFRPRVQPPARRSHEHTPYEI